jgi:hypothetical protein
MAELTEKQKSVVIRLAAEELGFDRPVQAVRMVGGRFELVLLGGEVVEWVPPAGVPNLSNEGKGSKAPVGPNTRKKPRARSRK